MLRMQARALSISQSTVIYDAARRSLSLELAFAKCPNLRYFASSSTLSPAFQARSLSRPCLFSRRERYFRGKSCSRLENKQGRLSDHAYFLGHSAVGFGGHRILHAFVERIVLWPRREHDSTFKVLYFTVSVEIDISQNTVRVSKN